MLRMLRLTADDKDETVVLVNPDRIQDVTEVPFQDWTQRCMRYRTWVTMFDGKVHIVKETPGHINWLHGVANYHARW